MIAAWQFKYLHLGQYEILKMIRVEQGFKFGLMTLNQINNLMNVRIIKMKLKIERLERLKSELEIMVKQ